MPRIVLFGASGYTGDLTARALVGRGLRPLLAGRNQDRLTALAGELGGLETQVADVARPDSVRALVQRGDVLVSTVGPFARWGRPALDAAIGGGAHYIDSTGETPFIREVFEHFGPGAQAAGVGLLTAMGYDWVPGNLAGALALRDAGPGATRVDIGYFTRGAMSADGMSGGTRASAAGVMLEPSFAFRGGRLATVRGGASVRSFAVGGKQRQALSAGSTEHFALPRVHDGLRDVEVYLGWFGPATRAMQGLALGLTAITKIPGAKGGLSSLVGRAVKGSTGGPGAEARAGTGSVVVAEAKDPSGTVLASARVEGVNGYDFTAGMLAWAAEAAAGGGLQGTGALGPVDGFGLDALERGAAEAGISRVA
ncbi:MAG: saccharopine dehydrogenase family protein [Solirubrobacteraceae bacterium]